MRDYVFVVDAFFTDDLRQLVHIHRDEMTEHLNKGLHFLRFLLNTLNAPDPRHRGQYMSILHL